MRTLDRCVVPAPLDVVWPLAVGVEQWPTHLPHYRWVTRSSGREGEDGVVEMAAWRPFGVFRWPAWWRSEMSVHHASHEVRYRHIAGITQGMQVLWTLTPLGPHACEVAILHWWDGPRWPLIGAAAASLVIGPVFVHGIASRTLAGLARAAAQ